MRSDSHFLHVLHPTFLAFLMTTNFIVFKIFVGISTTCRTKLFEKKQINIIIVLMSQRQLEESMR